MLITLRVESSSSLEVADEHQSIPLASIQSMYPGAVGLYQQTSDNNKCFVQFDGKSFVAPKDGWSPTESYCINVNLGGDRNPFPLESYQKACDQLEQTVQVIRKLMSSTASSNNYDDLILCPDEKPLKTFVPNGKPNIRERHGSFRSHQYATFKSANETNNNRLDLWIPRKNTDEMERQFAELSSILVGKNAIIESQRRQLQTERLANEEMEKTNIQLNSEVEEWKHKYKALEQELHLIRDMGTKQEFMGNKVKMLNAELENVKNSNNIKLEEMQYSLLDVKTDLAELDQKHENLQSEHNKLIAEVDAKKSQLEELQRQTKKLETDLAEHQNQYAEQSKCSHDLEERLCRENIGLAEWSKKLELENKQQQATMDKLQLEMDEKIDTLNQEFETKISQLKNDYDEKCQETKSLNNLTDGLHRHLTQITIKYNELDEAYKELQSKQDHYEKNLNSMFLNGHGMSNPIHTDLSSTRTKEVRDKTRPNY